ncbi:MAG: hypothetical protein V3U75_04240 [Methylococcaceae bacterium]
MTEKEKKKIKRQAVLSLLNPPSKETMERYGSLENYLDPEFVLGKKPNFNMGEPSEPMRM